MGASCQAGDGAAPQLAAAADGGSRAGGLAEAASNTPQQVCALSNTPRPLPISLPEPTRLKRSVHGRRVELGPQSTHHGAQQPCIEPDDGFKLISGTLPPLPHS